MFDMINAPYNPPDSVDTADMSCKVKKETVLDALDSLKAFDSVDVLNLLDPLETTNAIEAAHTVENTSDPVSTGSKVFRKQGHWKQPNLVRTKCINTASKVSLFEGVVEAQRTVRKPAKFKDSGRSLIS
jgi:uncharacterized protein (DUF2249 family)